MFVNFETTVAATRAEQHLAHLRANKLGPLMVEADRKAAAMPLVATPLVIPLVRRLVHLVRSARLQWTRTAGEARPAGGWKGNQRMTSWH
jgi:hypothetical protein